ncbi:hypothetical protein BDV59DRAFT_60611 [Aspergillus ambiguus]|uniref:uncharacterized protein n=1 Tax=Aspergillus ambiguus TaxID=176160 RepID=UPI003CCE489D
MSDCKLTHELSVLDLLGLSLDDQCVPGRAWWRRTMIERLYVVNLFPLQLAFFGSLTPV